jgi:hypothetical protein
MMLLLMVALIVVKLMATHSLQRMLIFRSVSSKSGVYPKARLQVEDKI